MARGNPYPHRYKFGKIEKQIGLDIFLKLMERVEKVDRAGYSADFIIGLNALFYWTGFRLTEVIGRAKASWLVRCKECKGKGCAKCQGKGRIVKAGPPHPGLLKEDFWIEEDEGESYLAVSSVGDKVLKHGQRKQPVYLHTRMPFVAKIVERWQQTEPAHRVFPISNITAWRVCKRMDPKFTWHFYRHNRVSEMAGDRKLSALEIKGQTGLSLRTIDEYMIAEGRYALSAGKRMAEKYAEKKEVM